MKNLFLVLFLLTFSVSFSQIRAISDTTNKKTYNKIYQSKYYSTPKIENYFDKKRNYGDVNMGIGFDNNTDFSLSFGGSYKFRYRYIGAGFNVDIFVFNGGFNKDVIDEQIPHNDYYITSFENNSGVTLDLLGTIGYRNFFLNFGPSFIYLMQSNICVSNVTGWKWRGAEQTNIYNGYVIQTQIYFDTEGNVGFNLSLDYHSYSMPSKNFKINSQQYFLNLKFGIYF